MFVYDKRENHITKTATLQFTGVIYIEAAHTGDFQATTALNQLLVNQANLDDLVSFLQEKVTQINDIEASALATKLLRMGQVPVGYVTMTAVPQWRLAYARAVSAAGTIGGIHKLV